MFKPRWRLVATDLVGIAVEVDTFWFRKAAQNEADFYNERPATMVDPDGTGRSQVPLMTYTVEAR